MSDSEGFSERMDVTGSSDEEDVHGNQRNATNNTGRTAINGGQTKQKGSPVAVGERSQLGMSNGSFAAQPDVVSRSSDVLSGRRDNNVDQAISKPRHQVVHQDNGEVSYNVQNPNIDMESYVLQYKGFARLQRLQFIAAHCPPLRVEALKYAVQYAQMTQSTRYFEAIRKQLENVHPGMLNNSDSAKEWVINQDKKALLKLHKLDDDLKNCKNTSNKQGMWQGFNDLGDHYLDCGEFTNSIKNYCQAKDYCSNGKDLIKTCINVVQMSVLLRNWNHVITWANQVLSSAEFDKTSQNNQTKSQILEFQIIPTQMYSSIGLAELENSNYKTAALKFLSCAFDHLDNSDLLSQQNVTTYGSLCAMATFTRNELRQKVIKSPSFKSFLELDPHLRETLNKFYASKYDRSLKMLEEMREHLLCDLYLAKHVNRLFNMIRKKAIVQYFSPYSSADLNLMASAFGVNVTELENELMFLILDGEIEAKIDSHNKVLISQNVDKRNEVYERVVQMSKEYKRKEKMLLFRSAVVKNDIEIKSRGIGGFGAYGR